MTTPTRKLYTRGWPRDEAGRAEMMAYFEKHGECHMEAHLFDLHGFAFATYWNLRDAIHAVKNKEPHIRVDFNNRPEKMGRDVDNDAVEICCRNEVESKLTKEAIIQACAQYGAVMYATAESPWIVRFWDVRDASKAVAQSRIVIDGIECSIKQTYCRHFSDRARSPVRVSHVSRVSRVSRVSPVHHRSSDRRSSDRRSPHSSGRHSPRSSDRRSPRSSDRSSDRRSPHSSGRRSDRRSSDRRSDRRSPRYSDRRNRSRSRSHSRQKKRARSPSHQKEPSRQSDAKVDVFLAELVAQNQMLRDIVKQNQQKEEERRERYRLESQKQAAKELATKQQLAALLAHTDPRKK